MPVTSWRWVGILSSSLVWGVHRSSLVLESLVLLCRLPWMPNQTLLPLMRFPLILGLCVATLPAPWQSLLSHTAPLWLSLDELEPAYGVGTFS